MIKKEAEYIYVHDSLNHNFVNESYIGGNNYLWDHLERYALDVGLIYYPGDTNFSRFLENFGNQLQLYKRGLVFGYFNIDLLNVTDNKTKRYKALPQKFGYWV
ncbi:hypothetical protein KGM_200229 [Danaus plexippus plexippus]|uniref:Uncharacterized protein n=1 Tax=Danaus plexippus plexippus TaxID=278856 RepID=A0A212FPE9_DANPL|nr:hypothetical protein KGM_200229 [Danaus plexippus plexippus]